MTKLSKAEFPEIPEFDPWVNDVLDRKSVADFLTPVIASIRQPFVISLQSPYGTGKSFFLKAWRKDLENLGFRTAYFNAWETDFSHDAMSAFMVAMKRDLVGNSESSNLIQKFSNLAKRSGAFAVRRSIPLLTESLVRRMVGKNGSKEFMEAISLSSEDVAGLAGEIAAVAIAAQEDSEASMMEFRDQLVSFVGEITNEEIGQNRQTKRENETEDGSFSKEDQSKIIVLVDELDRCRPSYAIEVLECIKHFFAVDGLVFVLAIDDRQLKSAIASVYGETLDADGYLHRFIDWKFNIPRSGQAEFITHLLKLYGISGLKRFNGEGRESHLLDLQLTLSNFAMAMDLSLREVERCLTEVNVALRTGRIFPRMPMEVVAGIAMLRRKKRDELERVLAGEESLDGLVEYLSSRLANRIPAHQTIQFQNSEALVSAFQAWFLGPEERRSLDKKIDELTEEASRPGATSYEELNREQSETELARLSNIQQWHRDYRDGSILARSLAFQVFDELEMVAQFSP